MQHAVTTSLRSLLMEEGRVCLPGIGTLLVVEQPAMVSLMEGKAAAPCARVAFNGNLVVDDGRLRREIGPTEAEAFVRQTRENLDAGRTVILEGIGKLYPHQGGEIRFAAGGSNFDKSSFGLPTVDIRPIVRKEKAANPPPPPTPTAAEPLPAPAQPPAATPAPAAWDEKYGGALWYAAGLFGLLAILYLLFLLGGAIGSLFSADDDRATAEPRVERGETNRPDDDDGAATIDANDVRPADPPALDETSRADRGPDATRTNTAIIAIGLYSRQRNVDKQVRRLTEAGYTPYTDAEGRNTRLGVEVRYTDASELRQVLREIRSRYTREAFVMRVNGEERQPE